MLCQPRYQREPSSRSRGDTTIDRFGAWTSGVKKYATSALSSPGKEQLLVIDDGLLDEIDSDESDLDIMEPATKKARVNEEALQLTGYPLLPADDMDIESASDSDSFRSDTMDANHHDLYDNDKDDASNGKEDASIGTDDGESLHTFFDEELQTLQHGTDSHLFFDCVQPLPQGIYVHSHAFPHTEFHQPFVCPPDCLLPTLADAQEIMTAQEQRSCQSSEIAHRYIYICQLSFWNVATIESLRDKLLDLTKANHMDIVMLGQGFTNTVWSHTETLQHDAQKLWYYLQKFGRVQYDTVVTDYQTVPITDVTLSFLLMLPIKAVFGYLAYHGVALSAIPWKFLSSDSALLQLPVSTRVPYSAWCEYLIVLLDYLHELFHNEEDSFQLMHTQFVVLSSPTLTNRDAEVFVNHHFPDEGRLLTVSNTIGKSGDHLALIQRVSAFAKRRKYKAEVYEYCSPKWVKFQYYLLHNSYPPTLSSQQAIDEHCVLAIAKSVPDRHRLGISALWYNRKARVGGNTETYGSRSRLHVFLVAA